MRAAVHPSFTGTVFDVWRRAREIYRQFFDRHDATIVRLARREYEFRTEYRRMCDWVHNLEVLVRYLIITAALAIQVTVTPRAPKPRKASRRLHVIWDDKPRTWTRLHFSTFPPTSKRQRTRSPAAKPQSRFARTLPLARRLETLRRILVAPEASARRAAFHLARIAAANDRSNNPRKLDMAPARPRTRAVSRGWQAIESGLGTLMPLCEGRMDAWNRAPEPGQDYRKAVPPNPLIASAGTRTHA